ncbi:MAG: 16S rRNA (guanine(527)-N(7))-methyltransferase RsmG [Cyanobacteriota bacterium]|nr:16S rRNA (guanine(527)-N(7))-methyltransferase RsmG [Cyanobacteriota bacterium]
MRPHPLEAPGADDPTDGLWQALGWRPDGDQLQRLQALQEQLRQWNSRLNLTRLVEGSDYWVAQIFDSLWPLVPLLDHPPAGPLRLIDVGTGGGFPGLAVAIALPQAQLTLVDSVGRKLEAVRAMAASLGLAERVQLRAERVERTGRHGDQRGRYHLAMARAVATAPVVAEYLVPLLAPEGQALLYRGQWTPHDGQLLEAAAGRLQARVERVERCELPQGRGVRHAVWLQPSGPCPATYPRAVGLPAKEPLAS